MSKQTNGSNFRIPTIPAKKRFLVGLLLLLAILLIIRHLFFNNNLADNILVPERIYQRTPRTPVLVTVFYEALCPDSKDFITGQLLPAFKTAASLMEVQGRPTEENFKRECQKIFVKNRPTIDECKSRLIPYGKAQTFVQSDGMYRFDCQHGPLECQANKYHSCAIEAIQEPLRRLEFVACMIRNNSLAKEALHHCTARHNVENIDLIQKCFDSSHGSELLKLNGDATKALRPSIEIIPTITLDGSQGRQALILKDLLSEVCKIFGDTTQSHKICKEYTRN